MRFSFYIPLLRYSSLRAETEQRVLTFDVKASFLFSFGIVRLVDTGPTPPWSHHWANRRTAHWIAPGETNLCHSDRHKKI